MPAALVIAAKDLRQRFRDRSVIVISIVAPFSLAAIFALLIPADVNRFETTWAVVDGDRGQVVTAFRDEVLGRLEESGLLVVIPAATEAEATALVDRDEAAAAILIPAGFSAAIEAGEPAEIRIVGSVNASFSTGLARSVVERFGRDIAAVQLAIATVVATTGEAPDPATVARLQQAAIAQPEPIAIADRATANRAASLGTYFSAGMAMLFVFMAAQFGAAGLLAERRAGTLGRILASPVPPSAVLAGKLIVSLVVCVVSMGVIAVGSTLLLGASWGDPLAVAGLIGGVAVAASGAAILVVGFARTEDQAGTASAILALTLGVLGGSFFQLSQAPEVLTRLSVITPHRWFLGAIDDLAGGAGIDRVLPAIAVLVTMGVVAGAIGLARARRVVMAR